MVDVVVVVVIRTPVRPYGSIAIFMSLETRELEYARIYRGTVTYLVLAALVLGPLILASFSSLPLSLLLLRTKG